MTIDPDSGPERGSVSAPERSSASAPGPISGGGDLGVAIPAAGTGTRMGGARKAFLTLGGEPILLRALRPFLAHPRVISIAIALSPEDVGSPPSWLQGLDDRVRLVPGGATRLHSVRAALAALRPGVEVILVHDAARPLVTREIIDRCVQAAEEGEGGVAGWPAVDTMKEVDGLGRVLSTPDRDVLWQAQTPQAFPRIPLLEAYRRAVEEGVPATDDSALFSRYGGRVRMVKGAPWNLKVTHPEDVEVAELFLRRQEEQLRDR
jgi:2-C-methyl-D-erythritol 4-phosphate cytidylyltransferase